METIIPSTTSPTDSTSGHQVPKLEPNPLRSPDLNQLLDNRINEAAWAATIEGLPCLTCTGELQEMAIANNLLLSELALRIEQTRDAIADARQRNKRFISADNLDPFLRYYFTPSPGQENPLQRLIDDFPLNLVGNAISAIGIPFIGNLLFGDRDRDRNRIEIEALEVQVNQLERSAKEAENQLMQAVARKVIEIDNAINLFQVQRERLKSDRVALQVAEIEYRNGISNNYPQKKQAFQQQQTNLLTRWNELKLKVNELRFLVGNGQKKSTPLTNQ